MDTDVIVVGAGVAGCTTAILYGRAGLRVTVLERHRSAATYKALCGHFIQGGTEEMLRRTGLWDELVAAGAATQRISLWSKDGWAVPPPGADLPRAISLRRERLDPLLRDLAARTPGVTLRFGETVTGLVERDGRVVGVRTGGGEHTAALVVGADGYRSRVAELAGARRSVAPNERFGYWAYYRGVVPRGPAPAEDAQVWRLDPDVAIMVNTDDGLRLLAAFPTKALLTGFRPDPGAALERFFGALADGPDLSGAVRESKVVGTTDYPCVRHDPTPRPGVVLVGDAAVTSDPTPAPGCGWAFRSAEWLVDATAPALVAGESVGTSLRAYRRSLRFIGAHDRAIRDEARGRRQGRVGRLVNRAAMRDPVLARRAYLFASRAIPAGELLNPGTVVRALRFGLRAG
jgi:2-polyprenyl-6-methoxyphenol hydroxylase-like FAD-dependent oxidoreductase